jgi:hypothetical protein
MPKTKTKPRPAATSATVPGVASSARSAALAVAGLARLQEAAAAQGGGGLSEVYSGVTARYRFRCKHGHEWEPVGGNVRRGDWCSSCAKAASFHPDGLARLQQAAVAKGGVCLSEAYSGVMARYRFRCRHGHEWDAVGKEILSGYWCRLCATTARFRSDGLAQLQHAAASKGGVCLSEVYAGTKARHRFRCKHGHEWDALGKVILRGCWCSPCAKAARFAADGLVRLQQAAVAKGGVCLSEVYTGTHARYRFRCRHDHEWETLGKNILRGDWCSPCAVAASLAADGLVRLQHVAAAKGGVCLSDTYTGTNARYRFRCRHGHEWEATSANILTGRWCQRCANAATTKTLMLQDGLARLQQAAAARGGQCLSDTYSGYAARYRFRCAKGHEWTSRGLGVLADGQWCAKCAVIAQSLTIEDARAAAHANGGECLSETYVNNHTKLTWMCSRGHVWQTRFSAVRNQGCWCPECAHMAQITNSKSKARSRYKAAGQTVDPDQL